MSRHIDERIARYLDGEVSSREIAEIDAHVEQCARCSRALREARSVYQLLDGDEAAEPLRPMWPEVEGRLQRRMPVFDLPFAAATAAALVAGVMLGVLTFDRGLPTSAPTAEIAASSSDAWSSESELLLADIYLSDAADDGGSQ